jgi:hypothetical protein
MDHCHSTQRGLALPTALLMLLVVTAAGALLSNMGIQGLTIQRIENRAAESFQVAEGAVHDILGDMSSRPHLWRDRAPLNVQPQNYVTYSQLDYAATNGIPSCSGTNCLRNLYPTGGGLLKNFGPRLSAGATVNQTQPIWNQLASNALPPADVTLNGQAGFSQVERLDESIPVGTNLGADMSNNPSGGSTARNTRFRITGKTFNTIGNRTGQATIVVIAEIPAT